MIQKMRNDIPEDHPIRALFHRLTERGLEQSNLHDSGTTQYITDLLTDFVQAENMYRVQDESGQRLRYIFDLLAEAGREMSPAVRREYYKHLGDFTLFNLGLFPESLNYGRRTVSPDYYAETGRRSYSIVAEMDPSPRGTVVYRKLAAQFEQCVIGLNWVKHYINDPFFQYMFREFDIT